MLCWRNGYKVFVVYKCTFTAKLLCTQLLFGGDGGAGGLDIKYFLYINIYLLCRFYTPNYYVYYFFFMLGDWRIGYKVFVVYICIFIEKLIYTQLLFVFCFCFCCLVLFFILFLIFFRGRGRGSDLKYLLYIHVYYA